MHQCQRSQFGVRDEIISARVASLLFIPLQTNMETYRLPNFPPEFSTIHIALFRNVVNSPEVRQKLIRASIMEGAEGNRAKGEVDFGFVEGRLVSLNVSSF